jgi:signal transduction histidine kinase
MQITVFATRALVFVIVYSILLVLPLFTFFASKSAIDRITISLYALLASSAPFIYLFLQRRAELVLFKEKRLYQETLNNLSKSMINIRDIEKLFVTLTSTVVDAVKIKFAAIYLREANYNSFQLKSSYPREEKSRFVEFISLDNPLINILNQRKKPQLSEEIDRLEKINLDSGLVIPLFGKEGLTGFIILGAKQDNQMYTNDDLLVFENISYNTSLAIENCIYWHEIEDRQRQARLQEMDTYSYSLAHEIDNPMQVILGHATLLKGALSKANLTDAERKEFGESLDFILECRQRVSTMVEAIRDFGQKATGEHKPLNIEEVVESFSQLYSPQFKANSVVFQKTSQLKEPVFVLGEKPELMQVLVILANNALHAMTGLKEKKVSLNLELAHHDWVRICFLDNGYGIKPENLKIIFKPFVTSKASTEGTGMGLHNALRIVERHKGRIWAESEGQGKGATFFIEFPLAKDIKPEDLKDKEKSRRLF